MSRMRIEREEGVLVARIDPPGLDVTGMTGVSLLALMTISGLIATIAPVFLVGPIGCLSCIIAPFPFITGGAGLLLFQEHVSPQVISVTPEGFIVERPGAMVRPSDRLPLEGITFDPGETRGCSARAGAKSVPFAPRLPHDERDELLARLRAEIERFTGPSESAG